MGEKQTKPFQLSFNGLLKVDFQGSHVTSDGGLLLVRELDERLGLGKLINEHLSDSRQGTNKQFTLADLLRQSVYSRLAGYEDLNDAERISIDPTFRLIGSQKIWDRGAALTSTLHGFETEMLASEENLLGLMALNRGLVGQGEAFDDSERVGSGQTPPRVRSMANRKAVPTTDTSNRSAITRCCCSISTAIVWRRSCVPATCTAPRTGASCYCRRSSANRPKASRSLCGRCRLCQAGDLRGAGGARRGLCDPHSGQQEPGAGDRRHPVSATGKALPQAAGALQEFSLSGGELVPTSAHRGQGRAPSGRAIPARRIRCDQHELAEPFGGAFLQQARHGGAVDQRR